ncbi:flagellin, partial [Clostridium polynesiense]|uniref:flagellin N-terminal helical domain-containing protein n=1 Tax=Clostridium polynesiense TaxID=1325933 RepID=UPI00058CD7BD
MIINHNLNAMNAHRNMGMNTVNSGKAMEKLSSGLRINRAGDDAAGLSISEKMRAQIRGLDQASRNAQDGISLIQTAEGALSETHSILQRMRELTVQAANDTNVDVDRTAIKDEIDSLKSEIDRIATTTQFNEKSLLNGSLATAGSGAMLQIGANADTALSLEINIGAMDSTSLAINAIAVTDHTASKAAVTSVNTA